LLGHGGLFRRSWKGIVVVVVGVVVVAAAVAVVENVVDVLDDGDLGM